MAKTFFVKAHLKLPNDFILSPLDAISEYSSLALNGGGGVCDERKEKALESSRWYISTTKEEKKEEKMT